MFNIQSAFTYRTVPDYAEEYIKLSLQKEIDVKKEPAENDSPSSVKRIRTSMKVNCTAKLNKYFLTDNSISVDYVWKHVNHDPLHDVKDIVQSRLPTEVKRWIEEHVDDAINTSIDNDNSNSIALRCEEYVEDTEN
ncbi:hypothetical protein G6F46_011281 [Rhizopus delemar]|uniref:Uncharacterized protein n=2 Tax=Rhizopus TaxID=4842 RepID=A0A9P7CQL7_9FUNG|nr:hypothetical protein G6F55_010697 [Rhizopus delemar]KAG1547638.1 hypothetical protein G6F51_004148 [Rhizopus arrhizus]KAG1490085.1 hypothetical protein G6F54_010981 [Rhizopus delemar]KAG1501256.1 hypothetical protein G6F53_011127 [Rhizopus delemar]KAG1515701.1 hypothetical protein G6F52_009616 [Rhizopus delemar]